MSKGLGSIQQKILLLLFGGIALGLSGSPRKYFRVLDEIYEEWQKINNIQLKRAISSLYESKLICEKNNSDGTVTIFLTDSGKKKALTYSLDDMKIKKPRVWDKKWRIVLFDI